MWGLELRAVEHVPQRGSCDRVVVSTLLVLTAIQSALKYPFDLDGDHSRAGVTIALGPAHENKQYPE